MKLDSAINQSTTSQEFCQIFERNVNVNMDSLWGVDTVSIDGYESTVTTDFIAKKIQEKFGKIISENQEDAALRLADLLKNKIFIPLRNRITELDKSNCMLTLTYKIRNFDRIVWTPEDRNLTAGYFVLKHSMCIKYLDKTL